MAKPIVMTVEFTDKELAEKCAGNMRGAAQGIRHVELNTDHPYRGELDRLILELKERGVSFRAGERALDYMLSVDHSCPSVVDDETGDVASLSIVLGNEPGIALGDWSCKEGIPLWDKLEAVSEAVAKWYGA
jgi:hypothetical protein